MDYSLLRATTPEDKMRVDEFVREHFLPDMPLIRVFGVEDLPPPRESTPPQTETAQQKGDFCVMAQNNQGDIVGVAINRIIPPCRPLASDTLEDKKDKYNFRHKQQNSFGGQVHLKKSKMLEMIEFMDWVEVEARLDTLPQKTIELRVLAVHREWRRRGVARRLAEESVRQAREAGHQAIRTCCTSEYTARLARSLGWRQHYCLRYLDYPGDVQLTPHQTHEYVYYYVTELDQEKEWEIVFIEDYYA
ncbi:uncharacterized protein LOC128994680 [Macrosteles quadrilineatus]|uniref:uncharacterized protein LOC128994680 n=1 Tax=Macrosteles quadrilineatus TaxID=74068 RepID=UPI0023E1C4D8|nr:uncharacterized protein LOC128994680 [Macrosteles quadrilineatus]